MNRSPNAARLLASRARRRVQGAVPIPDTDLAHQREIVDAFFAASRKGDFDALVALLDPDVVARADLGGPAGASGRQVRGALAVARQALRFSPLAPFVQQALVNGTAGAVVAPQGQPSTIMGFTIRHGKITQIDILGDPDRIRQLDLPVLNN